MKPPRYYRSRVAAWWRALPPTAQAGAISFGVGLLAGLLAPFGCRVAPAPVVHEHVVVRRSPPTIVTEYVGRAAVAMDARDTARTQAARSASVRKRTEAVRKATASDSTPAIAVRDTLIREDSTTIVRQADAIAKDSVALVKAGAAIDTLSGRIDHLETVTLPRAVATAETRGRRRGFWRGVKAGAGATLAALGVLVIVFR
jgi:hypothetical protein